MTECPAGAVPTEEMEFFLHAAARRPDNAQEGRRL